MAGWVTTPLQPFSLNATPMTASSFFGATPASAGYAVPGTSTIAAPTAWGGNNVVFVPNTGSVFLWYYCGTAGAGVSQVLIGEVVAGAVMPAATVQATLAATSCGWLGPFSPALYNIVNVTLIPTGVAGAPAGNMPAAAAGCLAFAFTTTTNLTVAAFTFQPVVP